MSLELGRLTEFASIDSKLKLVVKVHMRSVDKFPPRKIAKPCPDKKPWITTKKLIFITNAINFLQKWIENPNTENHCAYHENKIPSLIKTDKKAKKLEQTWFEPYA